MIQNQESNMVWVVPIANGIPEGCKISWREVVEKKRRYFHPYLALRFPKTPPNYFGFRYDGKLQRIHHVESWKVVRDLRSVVPEWGRGWTVGYIAYKLGPAIFPQKTVLSGNIFGPGHNEVMLDLLLSCNTIAEAHRKTRKRLSKIEWVKPKH